MGFASASQMASATPSWLKSSLHRRECERRHRHRAAAGHLQVLWIALLHRGTRIGLHEIAVPVAVKRTIAAILELAAPIALIAAIVDAQGVAVDHPGALEGLAVFAATAQRSAGIEILRDDFPGSGALDDRIADEQIADPCFGQKVGVERAKQRIRQVSERDAPRNAAVDGDGDAGAAAEPLAAGDG